MISKPKFKICRRLGPGIFDKCQTAKFASVSGKYGAKPGAKKPKALSEFGNQLLDKQRIRFSYGITEKQFSNYVKEAVSTKGTTAANHLYERLETRLDNSIYKMGLAVSRAFARQMVSHGHFMVNGHKVTIPSFQVKPGDVIRIREGSQGKKLFEGLAARLKDYNAPVWVSFDTGKMEGKVLSKPKNEDASFLNFSAVLEFYSR